ncbi:hypothetical protein WDY80_23895 (plasmid) [Gordonia hongkongensis]|uniref:hypothetical protein n=1 Tax=Gordonia hongkongensis TaxID=1701090 RepID=UPI0030CE57F8
MPRPSTDHLLQAVCERAGASEASVKNFFNRPGRLSAEMRQRIGVAVAEVGYRPARRVENTLNGVRIGYQLPRTWGEASPAMNAQLTELVAATQHVGAVLIPFVVDSAVRGVDDVVDGTPDERQDPILGRQAWHRRYTSTLAPAVYTELARTVNVQAFIVNDISANDPRLEMLHDHPEFQYLAFGYPGDERHPYIETDNDRAISVEVELLRQTGCRTFGHVGFADDDSIIPEQRRASVRTAVGHDVPRRTVHYADTGDAESATVNELTTWLDDHPDLDAVLCDSDKIAYLVHIAGIRVGRSLAQNPDGLQDLTNRTLMLTGNDNSEHRMRVKTEDRWMTLFGDSPAKMRRAVDLLAQQRAGKPTTGTWVPPDIIGAPGHTWNDALTLD